MEQVGVVFGSLTPAEELAAGARAAEEAGFTQQWFSEDCYFSGGLSGVAQLLASTSEVQAGLGLVSVVTRHPAVLAMELSTVAHEFHGISLELPPAEVPELWLGAVNERALRAGGEMADGVLLSVLAGPSYIRWASGLTGQVPVTAYVLAAVDDDPAVAREAVRSAVGFFLEAESHSSLVSRSQYADEVLAAVDGLGQGESLAVPDRWVDEFAAAGTPEQVAARLRALLDAGADSLGLWLFPPDRLTEQIQRIAAEVLPKLEQVLGCDIL